MYAMKLGVNFICAHKDIFQDYMLALLHTTLLLTGNVDKESKLDDAGIEVFVEAVKDLMKEGLI